MTSGESAPRTVLDRKARVLVVEDDERVRVMLAKALQAEGHGSILAATGRSAFQAVRDARPDVIILDLRLPDLSGLSIAEKLHSDPKTRALPIIILSAMASEGDRIRGLEAGADDYVTKPFSVRELMLRVRIALRRSTPLTRAVLEHTRIRVDTETHRAFVDGTPVPLTPIEFGLLAALLSRSDQVQSRDALLADVWGASPDLATRTVDTHIKRLRLKLGGAAQHVQTVRGIGYRFVADPSRDHAPHAQTEPTESSHQ